MLTLALAAASSIPGGPLGAQDDLLGEPAGAPAEPAAVPAGQAGAPAEPAAVPAEQEDPLAGPAGALAEQTAEPADEGRRLAQEGLPVSEERHPLPRQALPLAQNELPAAEARYGLFAAESFLETTGAEAEGLLPPAAAWHFHDHWIAVPRPGLPATGRAGSAAASAGAADPPPRLPPLVWLRAPRLVEGAQLLGDDRLRLADGTVVDFSVVPPLPANDPYVDPSTSEFLARRPLRLRGHFEGDPLRFVAATAWPQDARIPWRELRVEPLVEAESLDDLVRAQAPDWPAARLLWERRPGAEPEQGEGAERDGIDGEQARDDAAERHWADLPVLAIVLSGAQGDAPGSHGGHIAVATGRLGADGQWSDWLANNIYPIEVLGEKGILSGPVPMDNYLADLNSGQAMYRPVTAFAVVLRTPELAEQVQEAFHDFFLGYWCFRPEFERASHNSTEMSVDVLRGLGWDVPRVGGTSWWKGAVAAAGVLVVTRRPRLARQAWSFFTEERTDLLPRVAFQQALGDLLELVDDPGAAGTPFEALLHEDARAVLFLRFPQIPSSRPFGTYPVVSVREYRSRVGLGQAGMDPGEPPEERVMPEDVRRACRPE